jgi:hypothetical protein
MQRIKHQQLTKQDGTQRLHNERNSICSLERQLLRVLVASREEVGANILAELAVHCKKQKDRKHDITIGNSELGAHVCQYGGCITAAAC